MNLHALKVFFLFTFILIVEKGYTQLKSTLPDWAKQANVYEVNIRQYTKEGTFNAFAKQVGRLKNMGVKIIWFMPINPISKTDRKGSLGSYYAVSDYTAINPEFGTLQDFNKIIKLIHNNGMKVIIDWVPNHTGADHRWLKEQPDFFVKDSLGKAAIAVDWSDTRQLNYQNLIMQDSMVNAMKYWIKNSDIDGFRCDVAWNVPGSFWKMCIAQLRQLKNIYMLAEGEDAYLPQSGFDAIYPWRLFHVMVDIASGKRNALALDTALRYIDAAYTKDAAMLYFTSNHDENSWNKADYATMPGAVHEPFAILTQTLPRSIPLIYSGQEEPILRPIAFFEKDVMEFSQYKRSAFYTKILKLRAKNAALATDIPMKKINTGNDENVYAFYRKKGKQFVLVVVNLSSQIQPFTINQTQTHSIQRNEINELISGKKMNKIPNMPQSLMPWESRIYY